MFKRHASHKKINQLSLIERLLNKSLDEYALYERLIRDSSTKIALGGYGGFGTIFQDIASRPAILKEAFRIDDEAKSVKVNNPIALARLTKLFGEKNEYVHKNLNKQVVCLAILAVEPTTELASDALSQLEKIFTTKSGFKKRHEQPAILKLIHEKQAALQITPTSIEILVSTPTSTPNESSPIEKVESTSSLMSQHAELTINEEIAPSEEQTPIVLIPDETTEPSNLEIAATPPSPKRSPELPKEKPISPKLEIKIETKVNEVKQGFYINMINAIRHTLIDNIDLWHKKTKSLLFFGGNNVKHPLKNGETINVQTGIALMLRTLEAHGLIANDAADENTAEIALQEICRVAFLHCRDGKHFSQSTKTYEFYRALAEMLSGFHSKDAAELAQMNYLDLRLDPLHLTDEKMNQIRTILVEKPEVLSMQNISLQNN